MMSSTPFSRAQTKAIQNKIKRCLERERVELTRETEESTRAAGDAIQKAVSSKLENILGKACKEYKIDASRKAFSDMQFMGNSDIYCAVDVKSHNLDSEFNMPNLTSARRLIKFYDENKRCFILLIVEYTVNDKIIVPQKVVFVPIEHLDWGCLTIGALGWGQVQIRDSKKIKINRKQTKRQWVLRLCINMIDFYSSEQKKIVARRNEFKKKKAVWKNR